LIALNACTLALIDSGFPMYTLPISICICGVLPSSSSSISYYVDPNKIDENTNKKFINVFTFLVNSVLSLTPASQSGSESSSVFEILKGQSNLIASECMGEFSSDEFMKSASIGIIIILIIIIIIIKLLAMSCCEAFALFIKKTIENHHESISN